jgi:MarR family transcriptional regulator, organic hydroperoxide resistance regulator
MKKDITKEFTNLMNSVIQKVMILDRAEKVCFNVTLTQAYTIGVIRDRGMLTMSELSQELGLAVSTLTRIHDVLVRDGIVCRYHDEQDRRKVNICLTEKGKELAQKLEACSEQFWSKILTAIPEDKKDEMTEILKLILNALEEMNQTCCQMK